MDNRFINVAVTKYLLIALVIASLCFGYFHTKDVLYLFVILISIALVSCYEFMLIIKNKGFNKKRNIYEEEIEELIQRIENQKDEIDLLYKHSTSISFELDESINRLSKVSMEIEKKNEELAALRDASQIITSTFDIPTIVEYLFNVLNRFTGCDRYFIVFYEKETGELVCKYEFGNTLFNEVGSIYEGNLVINECFQHKKLIILTTSELESRKILGDKIAIPLSMLGEVIGVMYIESGFPETFSNINVGFLESLSTYAVIAIKNAEMFDNVYMQKQEIEALYEETSAVNEELSNYIQELDKAREELKDKNDELTAYYDEIHTAYLQTVMSLSNSIEAKDAYTRGHCQRVMEISCEIASRLGYEEDEIENLRYAAILHDIGKIGISAAIINKQSKLTDEEFDEIKKHPLIAHSILKDVSFLKDCLDGILQHHERFDGRGYPYGLKEMEICESGRIMCVADAFDAMTSDRPYRKGLSMEAAVQEIERCKGSQFDPGIADLFIEMSKEIMFYNEVKVEV